ncbi:uncharacterized protein ACHE_60054A [Aspergillus chevalieri]|uniref:Uncharacterized protein n=1 Tax=Aspergillus chevalieri TaxID=182096 RepID=A0A7R7ZQ06_ASPCH|nr:uncharacterized protein ACHE_60054A [Aspergillus chevalieri]BCR90168.1 hypothetical protein ACHE_60054A [Aspergillus chevalieri]
MSTNPTNVIRLGDSSQLREAFTLEGLLTIVGDKWRDDDDTAANTWIELRTAKNACPLHIRLSPTRNQVAFNCAVSVDNTPGKTSWIREEAVTIEKLKTRENPRIIVYDHGRKHGYQILFNYQTVAWYKPDEKVPDEKVTQVWYGRNEYNPPAFGEQITVSTARDLGRFK